MTKLEERYWELREAMDRAEDRRDHNAYIEAEEEYIHLCTSILEEIMEEHSDVLKRLKNIWKRVDKNASMVYNKDTVKEIKGNKKWNIIVQFIQINMIKKSKTLYKKIKGFLEI